MAKAATTKAKKGSQKPSAQLIEGNNATDLPIEEIAQLPAPAVIQPPAQLTTKEKAALEVARFDLPRAWIAEKKEQYKDLTIAGVDDKEGYKKVKEAWQEMRGKRLDVDKNHKAFKADYLTITQALDKEKRDLTELLEEVENPLKAELDRIEAEKEAIKQRVEREKAAKLQGRVNELLSNGMAFNGSYYAIGDSTSMDVVSIQNMDDEGYNKFLEHVKKVNANLLAEKEEKERKEQEERDRLEAQRKQQEEDQKKLDDQKKQLEEQQAAIDKQKKEAQDARTKARGYHLEALGMFYNYGTHVWEFKTVDCGNHVVHRGFVESLEGEQWEKALNSATECVKKLKEDQAVKDEEKAQAEKKRLEQEEKARQEAEAQRQRIATRKTEISALYGMTQQSDGSFKRHYDYKEIAPLLITQSQLENYTADAWAAEMENLKDCHAAGMKLQADAKTLEEAATEKARQAALSDRDRVNEWLRNFAAAMGKKPEINDAKLAAAFQSFDTTVAAAVEDLTLVLDNIQ